MEMPSSIHLEVCSTNILGTSGISLSNYISAEEACHWTGKRKMEQIVAETESISGGEGGKEKMKMAVDLYQPQRAMISQG
jgi:hypothetical protein